jgi:hypothetical protein
LPLHGRLSYLSSKKTLFSLAFAGIGLSSTAVRGDMLVLDLFYEDATIGA